MEEPATKRAVAFFDGQNLYRHAKEAFGHHHPNYDPIKLTNAVCKRHGWASHGVRFYTGTPSAKKAPMWHGYWSARLLERNPCKRKRGASFDYVLRTPLRMRNFVSTSKDLPHPERSEQSSRSRRTHGVTSSI
jgi:hypothetical protein